MTLVVLPGAITEYIIQSWVEGLLTIYHLQSLVAIPPEMYHIERWKAKVISCLNTEKKETFPNMMDIVISR